MTAGKVPAPGADGLSVALGVAALAGLFWALLVEVTGGVTFAGGPIRLSSHEPSRALLVSLCAVLLLALRHRRLWTADAPARSPWPFQSFVAFLDRAAPWLAAGLAVVVALHAIGRGAAAAGGSDVWGYISQAELMTQGTLEVDQPIARSVPWPFPDWTFSPLGYRPSERPGVIVPTYAPGLPVVMAVFQLVGGRPAVFLVVPLLSALAVFVTYLLGVRLGGRRVGLVAAGWLATSPAFVFSSLWPMSDVPVTTWWMLVGLALTYPSLGATALGGLAGALAVLTRPNLLFLTVPFGIHLLLRWRALGRRRSLAHAATFAAGIVPACLAIAWLNNHLYGSPLQSGYGSLSELYGLGNLVPSLERYPGWIVTTQSPLILACVAAPWARSRPAGEPSASRSRIVWLWLTFSALVWLSYLFYVPFDAWWYLRFLLPAFPLMICLSVYVVFAVAGHVHGTVGPRLAVLCFLPFLVWETGKAADLTRNSIRQVEHRYQAVGEYVARELPAGAVLLSMQHSGSLRYYSGRTTLRYDWLAPGRLPDAIQFLVEHGHEVFIVLDDWEEPEFRRRFGESGGLGLLDWPPTAEYKQPNAGVVRIYDPRERPTYWAGRSVQTQTIPVHPLAAGGAR